MGGGGGEEEEGERWRRTAEETATGAKPHGSIQSWSKKSRSNNRKRLFVLTPLSELPSSFTPALGARKNPSYSGLTFVKPFFKMINEKSQ